MKTPLTHEQKAALLRQHADRIVDTLPQTFERVYRAGFEACEAKVKARLSVDGKDVPVETLEDDGGVVINCGAVCCDQPPEMYWLLWLYCGPLGLDCPCYGEEEPPEGEG